LGRKRNRGGGERAKEREGGMVRERKGKGGKEE